MEGHSVRAGDPRGPGVLADGEGDAEGALVAALRKPLQLQRRRRQAPLAPVPRPPGGGRVRPAADQPKGVDWFNDIDWYLWYLNISLS